MNHLAVVEVVKYDGSPDVFAWKYPNEEMGTWTQLIVNQSQEALLFKGGRALDLFGPGRHTLSTYNIPFLKDLINIPFGGKSPFTAEVWYVNRATVLDVKWGTASPVKLQDPKYNVIVPVRAFGQFGITIEDSRKFLVKLVGTVSEFTQSSLSKYIRGVLMMNINEILSSYLVLKKISILEINAYISEISAHVEAKVKTMLEPFGILLHNFYIDSISSPEDDPSIVKLRDALARKAEMDIIGYNYQQERTFDTLEGAAKNEGSAQASLLGAGLGFGMGTNLGGAFGNQMGQLGGILNTGPSVSNRTCLSCNSVNDINSRFCNGCGKPFTGTVGSGGGPAPKLHSCNKCGEPMANHSKFCSNCGDPYNPCPKCGADCEQGSTHCDKCGADFPKPCKGCGEKIDSDVKFCPHCGTNNLLQCSNCGSNVEPNQRFCRDCGHNLT
ncbi:SPFH domain-containing protein [Paenibacillus sp. 2TAB19]|uniref:SPFH domain-containing protein n=1 Tax=Paenibacillus sp. 2TAB19 TaxID=3233003 RepID=UPI003F95E303